MNRREMFKRSGAGAGLLGLAGLLADSGLHSLPMFADAPDPLAPRAPQFPVKAKSVIWLFINGGPSQVDTWDYKPELA